MQTEEGALPLSCLIANGDVSSGTESTLLQTAPDSADAQWVSAADHRDGTCCMREDPALEAGAHVVLGVTGKKPQQSSKADHGFRVWFHNSI